MAVCYNLHDRIIANKKQNKTNNSKTLSWWQLVGRFPHWSYVCVADNRVEHFNEKNLRYVFCPTYLYVTVFCFIMPELLLRSYGMMICPVTIWDPFCINVFKFIFENKYCFKITKDRNIYLFWNYQGKKYKRMAEIWILKWMMKEQGCLGHT